MASQQAKKSDYDVICIGGGASGLYFAHLVPDCLLIEKMDRVGSKLSITGGGACNFTHEGDPEEIATHYYDKRAFVTPALYEHSPAAIREHFSSLGVESEVRENGCVFPKNGDGETIVMALAMGCRNILTSCAVTAVKKTEDGGFMVATDKGDFTCRRLVLATGGLSYPETGSTGDGYAFARKLRCRTTNTNSGLCRIHFLQPNPFPPGFEGMKVSNVKIWQDGKSYEGDIMITRNGLTGPGVLNLSRYTGRRSRLTIEFFPLTDADFDKMRNKALNKAVAGYTGLPQRLVDHLLEPLGNAAGMLASQAGGKVRNQVLQQITRYSFSASTWGETKYAMVTVGGVDTNGVSRKTFESSNTPGLYIIGELLDVDGECGGYNLTFAFASAYSAAKAVLASLA